MIHSILIVTNHVTVLVASLFLIKFELTRSFGEIILHEICFLIAPSIWANSAYMFPYSPLQLSIMEIDIFFSYIIICFYTNLRVLVLNWRRRNKETYFTQKKFIFHFAREKLCSIYFYTRKVLLNLLKIFFHVIFDSFFFNFFFFFFWK